MNVAVDPAGGEDLAFARNRLGTGTDDNIDAWLHVRIAGFADAGDAAIAKSHVGLNDAGVVDDQGVGDNGVDGAVPARGLPLPHAIADHLAAAEFHLLAVNGEVLLHLHHQIRIGEPHLVAGGGSKHVGVGGASHSSGHAGWFPLVSINVFKHALLERAVSSDRTIARPPDLTASPSPAGGSPTPRVCLRTAPARLRASGPAR